MTCLDEPKTRAVWKNGRLDTPLAGAQPSPAQGRIQIVERLHDGPELVPSCTERMRQLAQDAVGLGSLFLEQPGPAVVPFDGLERLDEQCGARRGAAVQHPLDGVLSLRSDRNDKASSPLRDIGVLER